MYWTGAWLSLVEHLIWDQGVASSNLVAPIKYIRERSFAKGFFFSLPEKAAISLSYQSKNDPFEQKERLKNISGDGQSQPTNRNGAGPMQSPSRFCKTLKIDAFSFALSFL